MPTSAGICKRRKTDVIDLMMKDFKVDMIFDDGGPFDMLDVEFHGPKDTPYEDGVWKVHVHLSGDHPYSAPNLYFGNRIFHPNIDYKTGAVCLEVLSDDWSPVYDLVNVFEIFLPQFLSFPNPRSPYNLRAGSLLERDKEAFEQKVRNHCARYAKKEDIVGNSSSSAGGSEEGSSGSSDDDDD